MNRCLTEVMFLGTLVPESQWTCGYQRLNCGLGANVTIWCHGCNHLMMIKCAASKHLPVIVSASHRCHSVVLWLWTNLLERCGHICLVGKIPSMVHAESRCQVRSVLTVIVISILIVIVHKEEMFQNEVLWHTVSANTTSGMFAKQLKNFFAVCL